VVGLEGGQFAIAGRSARVGDPLSGSDPQEPGTGYLVGEGPAQHRHRSRVRSAVDQEGSGPVGGHAETSREELGQPGDDLGIQAVGRAEDGDHCSGPRDLQLSEKLLRGRLVGCLDEARPCAVREMNGPHPDDRMRLLPGGLLPDRMVSE